MIFSRVINDLVTRYKLLSVVTVISVLLIINIIN